MILSKYEEKLSQYKCVMNEMFSQKITIEKLDNLQLKKYYKKVDKIIKPSINELFSTHEDDIVILKKKK